MTGDDWLCAANRGTESEISNKPRARIDNARRTLPGRFLIGMVISHGSTAQREICAWARKRRKLAACATSESRTIGLPADSLDRDVLSRENFVLQGVHASRRFVYLARECY